MDRTHREHSMSSWSGVNYLLVVMLMLIVVVSLLSPFSVSCRDFCLNSGYPWHTLSGFWSILVETSSSSWRIDLRYVTMMDVWATEKLIVLLWIFNPGLLTQSLSLAERTLHMYLPAVTSDPLLLSRSGSWRQWKISPQHQISHRPNNFFF